MGRKLKSAQIILLGTSHSLQCGKAEEHTDQEINAFRRYIHDLCTKSSVQLIAEEMSIDCLPQGQDTIATHVAKNQGIQHLYVDLSQKERKSLGIDDFSLANAAIQLSTSHTMNSLRQLLIQNLCHPIRERCWLSRIYEQNLWPTLFICGADHVENMRQLIRRTKQSVSITARDYTLK